MSFLVALRRSSCVFESSKVRPGTPSSKALDPLLQLPVAFQRLTGLLRLSGILVESGQQAVRHRVVGQEPDGLPGGRNRLVQMSEPAIDLGQTEMEVWERDGLALPGNGSQMGESRLGFSELQQQVRQLQAGLAGVRVIFHLLLQGLEGLPKPAGVQVDGGQVVVSPGVAGIPGHHRLELPERLAPHVLLVVGASQVHPGLEVAGIQFQGFFQEPDALLHRLAGLVPGAHPHGIGRVLGLASLLEYESRHAVVEVGSAGVQSQGLAQLGFGVAVLVELQQRHAVQVPVVGVLAVLLHGFLSRQHGHQVLLALITLFRLQVIGRLRLDPDRPEEDKGKRRDGR